MISMKSLLEAGVHFGHKTEKMDPRMKNFVFGARNGINIIDLQKTSRCIDVAYKEVRSIAQNGGKILFVGTKKQACDAVKAEAERCGMFYVNTRWLGGTLTNHKTLRRSVDRLHEIEEAEGTPSWKALTKKEISVLERKREKLRKHLSGIQEMKSLPDAMFVTDIKKDEIAVNEAKKLNIPVFALVDTNVNPFIIDYPIPANDDAIRAVALITKCLADAVLEGRSSEAEEVTSNPVATPVATPVVAETNPALATEAPKASEAKVEAKPAVKETAPATEAPKAAEAKAEVKEEPKVAVNKTVATEKKAPVKKAVASKEEAPKKKKVAVKKTTATAEKKAPAKKSEEKETK